MSHSLRDDHEFQRKVIMEYYYNISTKAVEEGKCGDPRYLLGPYPSRAEAEQALAKAAERTEAWDEADQEWADKGWDQ